MISSIYNMEISILLKGGNFMSNTITVKHANQNNLKNVTLNIPKHQLTVFTGVSGSGKSSAVFGVLATEAKRQLYSTFSAYVRNRLPHHEKPEFEMAQNLTTTIVVDQKPIIGNSRSTVGTMTDIQPMLRLLFSRYGQPNVGLSNVFSFNDPGGMCLECQGLGKTIKLDLSLLLDEEKSLEEGAICFPPLTNSSWQFNIYLNSIYLDKTKALKKYSDKEMAYLLYGDEKITEQVVVSDTGNVKYEGLVPRLERLFINKDLSSSNKKIISAVEKVTSIKTCPVCKGSRLNQAALSSKINGYSISDLSHMEFDQLLVTLKEMEKIEIVSTIIEPVERIVEIGLGYLSLDRSTASLSGGEAQRLKMISYLGNSLTDLTYIFDEPSIGLHPRDVHRLNDMMLTLRDMGNTIIVVEHDPDVIKIADHIIDMGPFAGKQGGEITYEGSYENLLSSQTLTGKHLNKEIDFKKETRKPTGFFEIQNATLHNLKNVDVKIPKGILTAVTGVAGSGKSSLIAGEFLKKFPETVIVNQKAIGRSSRATVTTYTGIFDEIRDLFSKKTGASKSLFSFNSKGACPVCKGLGEIKMDMAFMDPVTVICESCEGKRYNQESLSYQFNQKNIVDILAMTVEEALLFFSENHMIKDKLKNLLDVGLGYLSLGQTLSTLSGGELQRIKLATQLDKTGTIYVLDEPTTGLHKSDIKRLVAIFDRLVNLGNTVIIIEHNTDMMKLSDWIIDIGPEAGRHGGKLIYSGIPRGILDCQASITANYLK